MTSTSTHLGSSTTVPLGLLRALQVLSGLSVLSVLFQFVTAGQLLGSGGGSVAVHGAGAIALHVVTGLTTVVAFLLARRDRAFLRPALVAAVVFVATFVQAALGSAGNLALHVPGAMVVTVGAVWVFVDALRGGARS
jgi:hypothetical protein